MPEADSPVPGHKEIEWNGYVGLCKPKINPAPLLKVLGDSFGEPEKQAALEFVKEKTDKGSRVFRITLDLGRGPEELFVKTFDASMLASVMRNRVLSSKGLKRPWHYPIKLLKLAFEPSTALRCWDAALACEAAGVEVAEHLLFLSKGSGWSRREVLVTAGVNPRKSKHAQRYFFDRFVPPLAPEVEEEKEELLVELGKVLRAVRESAIMMPDFKLRNLVIRYPESGPPRFVVLDLAEAELNRPDYPEATFLERFVPSLPKPPDFGERDLRRIIDSYLEAGNDTRTADQVFEAMSKRAKKFGRKIIHLGA